MSNQNPFTLDVKIDSNSRFYQKKLDSRTFQIKKNCQSLSFSGD